MLMKTTCRRHLIGIACILAFVALLPSVASATLVGYWDFEGGGGTEYQDKSGNGHTLTPEGNATTGADTGRTALILDGDGDYVTTPGGSTNLNITNASITISAWIRWDDQGSADRAFVLRHDKESPDYNGYSVEVRTGSSYTARALLDEGTLNANPTTTDTNVSDGTWHHLAVRMAAGGTPSGTARFYLDGVETGDDDTDASNPAYGSLDTLNPSSLLYIGSSRGTTQYFTGGIDDVAVWNNAIPVSSIEGLADGTYTPLTAPVPEPVSVSLMLLAGLGLALRRRRA